MLEVENLNVSYGNIHALKGLSIEVHEGEIVSLIGSNGAGKTTLLRSIMHQLPVTSGEINLFGKNINNLDTADIVKAGLTMVPEGRRVFPRSSVLDNIMLGCYFRNDKEITKDKDRVFSLFPHLSERRNQAAGTLSGGEQQMLAMGRALMSRPRLLLLDEPSMGLAPIIVKQIFQIIKEINSEGTTILLVEQNANMALKVANRGYVLETGNIVLTGAGKDLITNEGVKKAYLGE
ncbi:MAG: ABC transporter ATP-binding protein [Negativicutes bacterium]